MHPVCILHTVHLFSVINEYYNVRLYQENGKLFNSSFPYMLWSTLLRTMWNILQNNWSEIFKLQTSIIFQYSASIS